MVENQRWYAHHGFEPLGRRPDEDIPRVHFRKPLGAGADVVTPSRGGATLEP
jgi:hypothetical protein